MPKVNAPRVGTKYFTFSSPLIRSGVCIIISRFMGNDKRIIEILKLLNRAYGKPKQFKRSDPVDELVRTVLSQNTNDRNSLGAFAVLKRQFKNWDSALKAPESRIAGLIRHAGLANIKAARIKEILLEIKSREGGMSLAVLERMDPSSGLEYLKSLKGVGPKTAACVLLFSFRKPVMPVDTHIFRVAKRLALLKPDAGIEEAHELITEMSRQALVPRRDFKNKTRSAAVSNGKISALIYELHLGIIEHGRRTCKAQNPRCGFCVLYNMCRFKYKNSYRKRT